jgi:hypothetical protein
MFSRPFRLSPSIASIVSAQTLSSNGLGVGKLPFKVLLRNGVRQGAFSISIVKHYSGEGWDWQEKKSGSSGFLRTFHGGSP